MTASSFYVIAVAVATMSSVYSFQIQPIINQPAHRQLLPVSPVSSQSSPLLSSLSSDDWVVMEREQRSERRNVPFSPVVPQYEENVTTAAPVDTSNFLAIDDTVIYNRQYVSPALELPKHSPKTSKVASDMEMWVGRISMGAAVALVANEISTGVSLPDQMILAATSLLTAAAP